MTPLEFKSWLQGYLEAIGCALNKEHLDKIKEKIGKVSTDIKWPDNYPFDQLRPRPPHWEVVCGDVSIDGHIRTSGYV
jgi:hypothetical protein